MEQRRLRLGDIIDDYCPRERRLSNHVVVAMIDDEVKQTRCTTCDADHPYKGARVPPKRKKKEAPAALYRQVLDGVQDEMPPDIEATAPPVGAVLRPAPPAPTRHASDAVPAGASSEGAPTPETSPGASEPAGPTPSPDDEGPVHRPLIRATLPRPEGQPVERKAPDFTLRLPGARLGPFRDSDVNGNRDVRHGKSGRPQSKGRHGGPKGNRPSPNGNRPGAFAHGPSYRPHGPHPRGRGPHPGGKKRSR
jgi:hypothetical protein